MKLKDYLIVGAIIIVAMIFLRKCDHVTVEIPPKEIIRTEVQIDTIYNTIYKEIIREVTIPEVVYVDSFTKAIIEDTTLGIRANKYVDSFTNKEITIYTTDIIDGTLLEKKLEYKLHVPIITKTITNDIIKYKSTNQLYLTTGVGGNKHEFNNLSLGVMFKSKKDWLVGYNYNILSNSHNFTMGTKLFGK